MGGDHITGDLTSTFTLFFSLFFFFFDFSFKLTFVLIIIGFPAKKLLEDPLLQFDHGCANSSLFHRLTRPSVSLLGVWCVRCQKSKYAAIRQPWWCCAEEGL